MIAVLILAGIAGAIALAFTGKSMVDAAAGSAPPQTGGADVSGAWTDTPMATATPNDDGTNGNIAATDMGNWRQSGITTDSATWPSGDSVWDICRAIAVAEGYNTNGAAFKLNNPGDISDGASEFGSEFHDGSNITHFPDAATGWNWLYNKINNHINGKSHTYPVGLTILGFAKKYAGNWQHWANNVGRELGVDPNTTTFAEYVNQ